MQMKEFQVRKFTEHDNFHDLGLFHKTEAAILKTKFDLIEFEFDKK